MNHIVGFFKITWLFSWLFLATILVFFPIIIAAVFTSTGNFAFILSRIWARLILGVSGVTVTINGQEKINKSETYIIISNHQSHCDGPAIAASLGIQFRWIAKKELLKIPVFGYALYGCRNIFIDRSNKEESMRNIRDGIGKLPPGVGVLFFAEGTRSANGEINKFKKGAFAAAIETGLPILPITVNGSAQVFPRGTVIYTSNPIEVVVGDPIETKNYSPEQIEILMNKTRKIISTNFRKTRSGP
ncbi:MAG: 1-acyl-sn-glycerol-3-phosphate acyltransferase [bacterium]|nr:1-acyl-sn-glycerol-3-phosphate acyltransferase [bacterium]